MLIQDVELKTGRLYWRPLGETAFIDFGNTLEYKRMPEIRRLPHSDRRGGRSQVDAEIVAGTRWRYAFKFDEHFAEAVRLLSLSGLFNDQVNAQQTGQNFVFTPVVGRSFFMGFFGVTITAAVDESPTPLIEGVHYTIDTRSGMITVLQVLTGEPVWTFTFNAPANTQMVLRSLSRLLTQGTFRLVENDQHDAVPLQVDDFDGQVWVTGWGEDNNEGFNQFDVEVLAAT